MTERGIAGLVAVHERGWRAGSSNLMGAGFAAWWKTKDWWLQALLWTAVINGSVAVIIWGDAPDELDVFMLYGVMSMFAAIAVAVIMQEAIVGEKRSGTAAWVLSKPASRPAFMLAKLVPNAVGVIATMIVIPSSFLVLQITLAGIEVSPLRFALGASVAALNLMFYLTLTLMLGTLFDSAGPVIAIPLAFAFGQQLVSGIPGLGSVLPWALVVPIDDADTSVVGALITDQAIPAPGAVVVALVACVIFTFVAFWKWNRTEL
jgi:ABC-2 type transport system permease protein